MSERYNPSEEVVQDSFELEVKSYVCKGYGCDVVAPLAMVEIIESSRTLSGWYCSDSCFDHPLNGQE